MDRGRTLLFAVLGIRLGKIVPDALAEAIRKFQTHGHGFGGDTGPSVRARPPCLLCARPKQPSWPVPGCVPAAELLPRLVTPSRRRLFGTLTLSVTTNLPCRWTPVS